MKCRRLALILTLLFQAARTGATTVDSYLRNREGVKKFNEKAYYPAYQSFLNALEEDPLNPEIQLNLGKTFEVNEEFEKAEKAYRGAVKLLPENSVRRFEALFNLGIVLGRQNKISDALEAYQAALEIDPESAQVKTNIELLLQGQGGGGKNQDQQGKGQDKDQQKDGEGDKDKDKKDQKNPQDQQEQKKPQPKPFQSQELTPQDVKKILDEIKNQEQSIRAGEYERNAKEAPKGKDW